MAEALGVAASIIAVIQLTAKLVSLGYDYIGAVNRAPSDLQELTRELVSLSYVLSSLQDYVGANPQSAAIQKLDDKNGPLRGCAVELRSLQLALEPKAGVKGVLKSLKWPLKEAETMQRVSRIERHKSLFSLALTLDNISLSQAIEAYVKNTDHVVEGIQTTVVDTNTTVQQIKTTILDTNVGIQGLVTAQCSRELQREIFQKEQTRLEILEWIYSKAFDTKHTEISGRRQKDTGKWLLRKPEFEEFVNGREGFSIVWGYGIPGAGKTFLSSAVIDHLQEKKSMANLNYGLAYIYFHYQEQDQQKPLDVLASLVKQLAGQIPQLPQGLKDLHKKLEGEGKRPTQEELYATFVLVVKSFTHVFLVFDALDECDPDNQRNELLPLFHRMSKNGVRQFITSRHYPEDIQDSFCDIPKIELSAKEEDITSYTYERIDKNTRAKRLVRQGKCREKIVSQLINSAQGMFLLVSLHIDYICQQTSANQILNVLEELRTSSAGKKRPLDPTYDRCMHFIMNQPESCRDLALKVLIWLVKGRRTLTVNEIRVAVSVEENRYELGELDLPDKAILLDVCAGLVTVDDNSDTIQLAHYTVQEYLLRRSEVTEIADYNIAMACATFLSFDIFAGGACMSNNSLKARRSMYPFLDYAATHLSFHLQFCDESLSTDFFLVFLASPGCISSYLQAAHTTVDLWRDDYSTYPDKQLPLHIASDIGHHTVVRLLLEGADFSIPDNGGWEALSRAKLNRCREKGDAVVKILLLEEINVSAEDSNGDTALHLAAERGHELIVQMLLDHGADISLEDRFGELLHIATSGGHEAVVRLLLDRGSDVSSPDSQEWTLLHKAASRGHEGMVRLLIDRGADVSSRDRIQETPLHQAASNGHEGVVQLLLDSGADASSLDHRMETPLYQAASNGHKGLAQILLDWGADVSSPDSQGWTPLHQAVYNGHEGVVQLLLDSGADASSPDFQKQTPLHQAASNGHKGLAQILLDWGADVSSQDSQGWTPLHQAIGNEHEGVAQLLLDRGADASSPDSQGWTPLHQAARNGHKGLAQSLLDRSANVSSQNSQGWTPLHMAAFKGLEGVARLLLDRSADISSPDFQKQTPLHLAVLSGQEEVVQLLLNRGADLSPPDSQERTPLHKVAARGLEGMARLLLDRGADVSSSDCGQETPLHQAASNGHEGVVQLLLDRGADLSSPDSQQRTPLHQAVDNGHERVAKLLLDRGADVSSPDYQEWTPLHMAAFKGLEGVARLLLDRGTNISSPDFQKQTPLHLAALNGHEEVTQLLLDRGADVSSTDSQGWTPLHMAASNGFLEVVYVLINRDAKTGALDIFGQTPLQLALWGRSRVANRSRSFQYGNVISLLGRVWVG